MAKREDFYQVSLKTILKNDKGEVLILKPPPGSLLEGYWDLPGGRIDTDEYTMPIPEIIARELEEEVGKVEYRLHDKPVALGRREVPSEFNKYKRLVRQLFIFFEADFKGGTIQLSDEHTEYRWVDFEKINIKEYFTTGILEGVQMYLKQDFRASCHPGGGVSES